MILPLLDAAASKRIRRAVDVLLLPAGGQWGTARTPPHPAAPRPTSAHYYPSLDILRPRTT